MGFGYMIHKRQMHLQKINFTLDRLQGLMEEDAI